MISFAPIIEELNKYRNPTSSITMVKKERKLRQTSTSRKQVNLL